MCPLPAANSPRARTLRDHLPRFTRRVPRVGVKALPAICGGEEVVARLVTSVLKGSCLTPLRPRNEGCRMRINPGIIMLCPDSNYRNSILQGREFLSCLNPRPDFESIRSIRIIHQPPDVHEDGVGERPRDFALLRVPLMADRTALHMAQSWTQCSLNSELETARKYVST